MTVDIDLEAMINDAVGEKTIQQELRRVRIEKIGTRILYSAVVAGLCAGAKFLDHLINLPPIVDYISTTGLAIFPLAYFLPTFPGIKYESFDFHRKSIKLHFGKRLGFKPENKYALIVVGKFDEKEARHAELDQIIDYLKQNEYQIICLDSNQYKNAKIASEEELEQIFSIYSKTVTEKDQFVFVFHGHGCEYNDNTRITLNPMSKITTETLNHNLDRIYAGSMIVFIASCYSSKGVSYIAGPNRIVIASSRPDKTTPMECTTIIRENKSSTIEGISRFLYSFFNGVIYGQPVPEDESIARRFEMAVAVSNEGFYKTSPVMVSYDLDPSQVFI